MTRKINASLFMSLDGVVESPDKWSMPYWSDELGAVIGAAMGSSTAMLLGRVTYEGFAAYWPGKTTEDDEGADFMNNSRKYVASTTLKSVEWNNSTLLEGDLADSIAALKAEDGGDIGMSGSPTLVRSLLALGLLDELHLIVYPIVVGNGKKLFGDDSYELTLKESKALDKGVLHLVYAPAA
jgi:dihydrofolate reductase